MILLFTSWLYCPLCLNLYLLDNRSFWRRGCWQNNLCVCVCVEVPGEMQLSDWWDCWVGERTTGGRSTHHTGSSHCHWCSWSVSLCLSVCLCVCLSVCVSVCLSVCVSVCLCWWEDDWREEHASHWELSLSLMFMVSVCLSVCLSPCICLSVLLSVSVCLSIHPFACLSVCQSCPSVILFVFPSLCLSVFPFVCPSFHLSVCLCVHLFVHPCVFLSVCMSVYLSVCLSSWRLLHYSGCAVILSAVALPGLRGWAGKADQLGSLSYPSRPFFPSHFLVPISPSFLFFLTSLSFSHLFSPKIQLGGLGSAVSFLSGVWSRSPAVKAFLLYHETSKRSGGNDFGLYKSRKQLFWVVFFVQICCTSKNLSPCRQPLSLLLMVSCFTAPEGSCLVAHALQILTNWLLPATPIHQLWLLIGFVLMSGSILDRVGGQLSSPVVMPLLECQFSNNSYFLTQQQMHGVFYFTAHSHCSLFVWVHNST